MAKSKPTDQKESALRDEGVLRVCGIDEVGRGAWAGPVVAAAFILPESYWGSSAEKRDPLWLKVNDSKCLSLKTREQLATFLKQEGESAVGTVKADEIDSLGIGKATFLAMERAVSQLPKVNHCLIDGSNLSGLFKSEEAIIDGDALVLSIAAASIIAKVYRDQLMSQYVTQYPEYGFQHHVGYGTKVHLKALGELGVTAIHRRSFKPVKAFLG